MLLYGTAIFHKIDQYCLFDFGRPHRTTMASTKIPEPELDSVLIAAQLARFCPTSLSFDNLSISCFKESKKKTKYEKNNEHNNFEYIPPKTIQLNNNNNTEKNNTNNSKSKFSFLLKSKTHILH